MKKGLAISLVLLASIVLAQTPVYQELEGEAVSASPAQSIPEIESSAIARWEMDDISDVGLNSSTGGSNFDLTVTGAGPLVRGGAGSSFTAALASGSSQYGFIADNASLSMGNRDYLLCAWSDMDGAGPDALAGKWSSTAAWRETLLMLDASGYLYGYSVDDSGTADNATLVANLRSAPTRHLFCSYYLRASNTQFLNVDNGDETASSVLSITPPLNDGPAAFTIGYDSDTTYLTGTHGPVILYAATPPLSSPTTKIAALWNDGNGLGYSEATTAMKVDLVAWWEWEPDITNGSDSGVYVDRHGSNTLATTGGPTTVSDGSLVQDADSLMGLYFISANDDPLISTYDGLRTLLPNMSMCAWAWYPFGVASNLALAGQLESGEGGFMLRKSGTAGSVRLYDSTGEVANTSAAGFTADTWHHVCFATDSLETVVYVDGIAGTPDSPTNPPSPAASVAFEVGASATALAGRSAWEGGLDQVLVWNYKLDASQAAALAAGRFQVARILGFNDKPRLAWWIAPWRWEQDRRVYR